MSSETHNTPMQSDNNRFAWKRVWDVPTRLFHWLLVICVCAAWYLGDNRGFETIGWHLYFGYAVGGLVVFRVLWGIIGPTPVRLGALFHGPASIFTYAKTVFKRSPSGTPGHNPLGSLSVIAVLLSLSVQVVTGLFAYDDGLFSGGPLSDYVSEAVILEMNAIHEINAKILLLLVALHVLAVLFYLAWKRENLIIAMVTGRKLVKATDDDRASGKKGHAS